MNLHLKLQLDGDISYINTHYPNEVKVDRCTHINLTSSTVWESHSETVAEQEAMVTYRSGVMHLS